MYLNMSSSSITTPLPSGVPTINDDISASGVRTGVTRQIHIRPLELFGLGITAQRDHAMPHLLHLLIHKVRQPRVNVAGRDAVDASEIPPLVGQGFGEVDTASLGNVVRRLLLRKVRNMSRHGRSDHEGAFLLLAEVETDGAGAVEGTGQVGVDDLVPGLDARIQDTRVRGPARVGDEDVNPAEIFDHVVDQLLDVLVVAHVALVGLGFGAVLFFQLLGILDAAFSARRVSDGDVGTHFSAAAGCFGADAGGAGGTGHDDDFALEAEELLERVGLGGFDGHDGG